MTLLRHSSRDPDPKWKYVNSDRIRAWREKVQHDLRNNERRQIEYGVVTEAHHRGLEAADRDVAGNPVLEAPAAEKPRSGRETVEIMTKVMVDELLRLAANDPGRYLEKVHQIKELGGLGHLTDEEAARQIHALCRKVTEMDVAQVYEQMGLMRKA